ncbi:MAG: flagellar protein [Candidatus Cohnella colombiensis]|uniref:Flagellar protein n=1 Tax=Candidatus Cohnella colombiensis TaxID=3121368 RepID=A0AA95EVW7_9BACL|nr:MAG: flagellar protein [Cohnella sp.]
MDLVYCPRCGKLFARHFREVCNNCFQELEKDYERCVEYLRQHRGLNIQQLSDETEISIKQITRWIKEGRISLMNAPNMSYPCEMCGTLIREGHMCEGCKTKLQRDYKNAQSGKGPLHVNPDESRLGTYQKNDRPPDRKL